MAITETIWSGVEADKLYVNSGQFTSTVRTSLSVGAIDSTPQDISWDGINTPWTGSGNDKLYLQSGKFSSTVKTSLSIVVQSLVPTGIDSDINNNTPWSGTNPVRKFFLQSGQFTSTLKTSLDISGVNTAIQGVSFDGTDTISCGSGPAKLYRFSGQFNSTVKNSVAVTSIDTIPAGSVFDGTNSPWCGTADDKFYLQSGDFTSTVKTSLSIASIDTGPTGITVDDYQARQGFVPLPLGGKPSKNSQVPRKDELKEKVEIEARKTEEEAWMVEKVMTKTELEKEKVIEDTNALIMGVKDLI